MLLVCGFKLNHDKHRKTKEFIDALFSLSMYPFIDRPSSITDYYPYRAFDGQNKIVYSRFVTRRAIFF